MSDSNQTAPKYPITERAQTQIDSAFTYHPPHGDQAQRYVLIRDAARALATLIAQNTPSSREQSLALTDIENAVMWANAAIARNEKP